MKKDILLYRDHTIRYTKKMDLVEKEVQENPNLEFALINNYSPVRGNVYNVLDDAFPFRNEKQLIHEEIEIYYNMEDCPPYHQIILPMDASISTVKDRLGVTQYLLEMIQCSSYCNAGYSQMGIHPEIDRLTITSKEGTKTIFGDQGVGKKTRKALRELGLENSFSRHPELDDRLVSIYGDTWMYGHISEFSLPFETMPRNFDYVYIPLKDIQSGYLLTKFEVSLLLATERITIEILDDMDRTTLSNPLPGESTALLNEIIIDAGFDISRFHGLLYTSTFLMQLLSMEQVLCPEERYALRIEIELLYGQTISVYISADEFRPFSLLEMVLKLLERQLAYNMRE